MRSKFLTLTISRPEEFYDELRQVPISGLNRFPSIGSTLMVVIIPNACKLTPGIWTEIEDILRYLLCVFVYQPLASTWFCIVISQADFGKDKGGGGNRWGR